MKKLLFLAGLIMVTAASCDSDNEGSGSNSKNKKVENYSLAFMGKNGEGVATFDVCVSETKDNMLYIHTSQGDTYPFPLSDIKEEYRKNVKKNQVSMINLTGRFEPIIFDTEGNLFNSQIQNVSSDQRMFGIKGILKDSQINDHVMYKVYYQYLFFCGYTKAAKKMMKENAMFFSKDDFFELEISPPTGKGLFSAIYLPNKEFAYCQSYFNADDEELVIRLCLFDGQETETLRNGATYRYPVELFNGVYGNQVRHDMASAIFTPEGNLFPAKLQYTGSWAYYDNMIHESFYYFDYGKHYDVRNMRNFLLSKGLGNIVTDQNFKGYFCMTLNE